MGHNTLQITSYKLQKDRGFTLIELLIVVAIIGLLSSVILVGLGGFRARGRDARRITDLKEVQNALEVYYTKNNKYPVISGIDNWSSLRTALTGGGIGVPTISNDPLYVSDNSKKYEYSVSNDQQSYALKATLEDSNNLALSDSPKGTITFSDGSTASFSCDPPAYCVQF